MKKTLSLSIGGVLFHVEDDAYVKLDSYLSSVRAHFDGNPDKEEILSDIEGRIAERFAENKGRVVNLSDVDEIIKSMGTADQFDDIASEDEKTDNEHKATKQLYRDQDNAIIAGISSGLGHFFGVDPLIFRLIFAFSLFLGGSGVVVYVILWILVPEAKTPSQKLSMRGTPVTISAMTEMLKEKIGEVNTPKHKNMFRKLIAFPIEIIRRIFQFINRTFFPFIRALLGIALTVCALLLAIGATFAASFTLFGLNPQVLEGPLLDLFNSTAAHAAIIGLYLVAIIPLFLTISFGSYLITKRKSLSRVTIASLLGIWFIAIPVTGALGTKLAIRGTDIVKNDPYYKTEKVTAEVAPFSRLVITDNQSVRLVQGESYKVELLGPARSLPQVLFVNATGTLTFTEQKEETDRCLFCDIGRVEIIVTAPNLASVHVTDSSHLSGEYEGTALTVSADNSSSYRLNVKLDTLTTALEDNSYGDLTGTTSSFKASASNNSRINADMLESLTADVQAGNRSYISLYAKETIAARATNNSHIKYAGEPEAEKDADTSSRIETREEHR